ncbi:MAG: LptF/LptG family permease [Verrucomicrobiota bacterium]
MRPLFRAISKLTQPVRDWLVKSPRRTLRFGLLGALLAGLFLFANTWDLEANPPGEDSEGPQAIYQYLIQLLFAASLCFIPMILAAFSHPSRAVRMTTTILLSVFYLAIWLGGMALEAAAGSPLEYAGVQTSPVYSTIRFLLIGGLILSPPIVLFFYERASILDQYVAREFLFPLVYCVIGFLAIVLIFDLTDNGEDFFDARASLSDIARFYLAMIPQLVVMVLPIAILLALLYALSRMSRSNETIAMLTAGKSLPRILVPIFIAGAYCSLICTALNFEWAPESNRATSSIHNEIITAAEEAEAEEKERKAIEEQLAKEAALLAEQQSTGEGTEVTSDSAPTEAPVYRKKKRTRTIARNHKYRNRIENRLWFVGSIPYDLSKNKMEIVEVFQQTPDGILSEAYYAKKARWSRDNGDWLLRDGIKITFDENGIESSRENFEKLDRWKSGWKETPWTIFADELEAEELGVPSLSFFLESNKALPERKLAPFRTHSWYRWSLPWGCLVIALVAAPLGVVFSRRGVLGGVAASIFIAALFVFFDKFFLTLGQSAKVSPMVSAWLNNAVFALVGGVLLYFRARNKELPKPTIENFKKLFGRSEDGQRATTSTGSRGPDLEFS